MGETARALSRLSNTLSRPGVGAAMLDAAKVDLGLRQVERQKEIADLARPGLELEAAKNRELLKKIGVNQEKTGVNQSDILPQDMSLTALGHFFGKRKDGKTLAGKLARSIANDSGATWDDLGNLVNGKGEPVQVPKRMLFEKVALIIAANTDPVHAAEDRLAEQKNILAGMGPDVSEQDRKALSDKIKAAEEFIKDPKNRTDLYSRYAEGMRQMRAMAVQYGATQKYLGELDTAMARANSKIKSISDTIAANKDYALKLRGVQAREKSAEAAMVKARTLKQDEIDKRNEANIKNLALRHGLSIDPVTGQVTGSEGWDAATRDAFEAEASALGLDVGWNEATDTSLFGPDKTTYTVTGLAGKPNYGGGRVTPGAAAQTPTSKTAPKKAPMTGEAATKEATRLIGLIDKGKVDKKAMLDQLKNSGQSEVGKQVVAHLKQQETSAAKEKRGGLSESSQEKGKPWKGETGPIVWDMTDVQDSMHKVGVTANKLGLTKEKWNKFALDVGKAAAKQGGWTWRVFVQKPWNEIEGLVVRAAKDMAKGWSEPMSERAQKASRGARGALNRSGIKQ